MNTKDFVKKLKSLDTLKEKRLFYLKDVIKHYNFGNRAVDPNTNDCIYNSTINSEGCAIGRRCSIRTIKKMVDYGSIETDSIIMDLIPKWMSKLGKGFLIHIQTLHDYEDFWTRKGLNDDGEEYVKLIKKYINEQHSKSSI